MNWKELLFRLELLFNNLKYGHYAPTSEDTKKTKYLAERLKGDNVAQTLSNILEWESWNINFWDDRWHLFLAVFAGFVVFLFVLSLVGTKMNPLVLGGLIVFLIFLFQFAPATALITAVYFTLSILALIFLQPVLIGTYIKLLLFLAAMFLGWIGAFVLYAFFKYRRTKQQVPNFDLLDMFKLSLPVDRILAYRLAVCRDFAKLTASVLANIFGPEKVVFLTIPQHVSAGVKIGEKIYMLDQRLPILNLEGWLIYWGAKKAALHSLKVKNNELVVQKERDVFCTKCHINGRKLKYEFEEMLRKKIEKAIQSQERTIELSLENIANFVDVSDEIIRESFLRWVKILLLKELTLEKVKLVKEIAIVKKEGKNKLLVALAYPTGLPQ